MRPLSAFGEGVQRTRTATRSRLQVDHAGIAIPGGQGHLQPGPDGSGCFAASTSVGCAATQKHRVFHCVAVAEFCRHSWSIRCRDAIGYVRHLTGRKTTGAGMAIVQGARFFLPRHGVRYGHGVCWASLFVPQKWTLGTQCVCRRNRRRPCRTRKLSRVQEGMRPEIGALRGHACRARWWCPAHWGTAGLRSAR